MRQQMQRQSLTSRQSFENSHSKKTKSIKSIRIVDHDKQNHQPHHKSQLPTQQYPQTARDHSPSPHEFSFKKPTIAFSNQNSQQWLLKDKLNEQQQQMKKLQRMLNSMTTKLQDQLLQHNKLKPQYEDYMKEMMRNTGLKRQICQLKDLMKQLLIEKENDRMMVFYQDD